MQDTQSENDSHVMRTLGMKGDTRVAWDPSKEAEVAIARASFEGLVRDKKYAAFRVNRAGERGEQIREFDASAREILLVPPVAGGA